LSDSEVDYCSGRDWARITPSQDEFDYAISLSSQISKLSLELPEDFDETFEQNLGQLHMPTPSPNGSYDGSIIKPSCEYDFESDDDDMNISASTHSSMPALIRAATESDDISVCTYSNMPELIPIVAAEESDDDDSESRKRRRMSQELCGNE
jgi:hypothetical protein